MDDGEEGVLEVHREVVGDDLEAEVSVDEERAEDGNFYSEISMRHKIILSATIIAAFFCGMYYERGKEQTASETEIPRVYLEQLKTKMNIRQE